MRVRRLQKVLGAMSLHHHDSLLSNLHMSLHNNRTLEILRRAELGGYGVLAQVWYENDWFIKESPDSNVSVTMHNLLSHLYELQNVREVQPCFSYFLLLLCMGEALFCAFA